MSGIYRSEAGGLLVRERYLANLALWPVDNDQWRIPTPEGETFVIASGQVTAPPLVLLHGSGSNSAEWASRIPELARHFRVYAIDMIGEPGLSAPSRPDMNSDAYALWLDAVLDHLELARVPIMAFSLGSWLAVDYATRRPERVDRLSLFCPTGIGRQKRGFLLAAILLNSLGRWGKRKTVTGMLGPGVPAMEAAEAEAFLDQVLLVSRHYRYRSEELPVFGDVTLRRLTMPVQVFAGERDVLFDAVGTARRIAATVPHATVRLLPGVGHVVPPRPEAELAFLAGAAPGGVA
ncbi:alpha/beta hydrolase [Amycolatopsis antarctica]|uniref:Alpha/beta hydrolase n=1 Tax=Amycolatopsis antarctica TaxID=1854586 RepID=A0A263D319_9PSEU|nr:alpha/beta fold hydrolase [Amycolatopsis antarctica]OZM71755.1 alpha/beta hydrolase [Amycolatopsis antarctica]